MAEGESSESLRLKIPFLNAEISASGAFTIIVIMFLVILGLTFYEHGLRESEHNQLENRQILIGILVCNHIKEMGESDSMCRRMIEEKYLKSEAGKN